MAIEIPGELMAAGLVDPLATVPELGPILAGRGWLAVDPNTTTDPATFTGGFARFAVGVYGMKMVDGADISEAVVSVNAPAVFADGAVAPQLPVLVGASLADGRSVAINIEDNTNTAADAGYQIRVTRFASEPVDLSAAFV